MAILLTLAGEKWNTTTRVFEGGAVVQQDSNGDWSELTTANTGAWYLRDHTGSGNSVLTFIDAADIHSEAAARGKLKRSKDQGATWADINPDSNFCVLCESDSNGVLWAVTDDRERFSVLAGGPSRIYRSTDDGDTWTLKKTINDIFSDRFFPIFNLAIDLSNADTIVLEGIDMVNTQIRMWRSTDGGDTWTAVFTPSFPATTIDRNPSATFSKVLFYINDGSLIYCSRKFAGGTSYVMRSTDDGDNFSTLHSFTPSDALGYSRDYKVKGDKAYVAFLGDAFEFADSSPSTPTQIADEDDAPFDTGFSFHAIGREDLTGTDLLHLGTYDAAPGVTEENSAFQRVTDLSSDWTVMAHATAEDMDADLGYVLYVWEKGLIGATSISKDEEPTPRPPKADEPPGGGGPIGAEPGVGDPGIGEARKPREKRGLQGRRGLRGRRGFKSGPPGKRTLPQQAGEQIDKSVPDEYEPPQVRKWLTFGWLTAPMLEGQKTITLRDWGQVEGLQWEHGELFFAYDASPVEGGKRLALLRVMQVPFEKFTPGLKMIEYHKLGYSYAMANQLTAPSGRTALQVWEDLLSKPQRLWLLRFQVERIFEQGRKERGTVNVGVESPIAR